MSYTEKDYAALLVRLAAHGDESYRSFNEGLMPGTENTYGVRMPVLRGFAREILRADWRGFLAAAQSGSHEERLLQGLVIAGAKCDVPEKLELLRGFIPQIDNWAVCDMVSGSFKWRPAQLEAVWAFLAPYLQSRQEFEVRFAVVQLMQYFYGDDWIDRALEAYRSVRHEGYYVTMALGWGLSVFFVKQREKTLPLLEQAVFPPAVHNKAIQKCRESLRVTAEDKALLNTLKR